MKPEFLVVGAPKCGTTALNEYLRQHPGVFIPRDKEPHYFGSDLEFRNWPRVESESEYLAMFSEAKEGQVCGESSVWYLYSKFAAREISEHNKDMKIIIMLRNPVDLLYSQHSQFLYNGNEDIVDFKSALDAEKSRKDGENIPAEVHFMQGLYYSETVEYSVQIQRYYDKFSKDNIHVIIYDEFKNDTKKEYTSVCDFLGVSGYMPEFKIINSNKSVRSEFVRRIIRDRPSAIDYFLKRVTSRRFRRFAVRIISNANKSYSERDSLSTDLEAELRERYIDEVEKLELLTGLSLSKWK